VAKRDASTAELATAHKNYNHEERMPSNHGRRSEMTSEAQALLSMCRRYLSSEITIEAFVKAFQEYFEDFQDRLSEDELNALNVIYMACEYYQPDEGIRTSSRFLLDEARAREIIDRKTRAFEATSAA